MIDKRTLWSGGRRWVSALQYFKKPIISPSLNSIKITGSKWRIKKHEHIHQQYKRCQPFREDGLVFTQYLRSIEIPETT